jgi:membrane protease YdiL (CAAX protease family)
MKAKVNKKNILLYILISFTFSWLIALIIYLFKLYKTGGTPSTLATVLLVVYMFGPAIAAAIVQKIQGKKIKDLGINFKLNSWWVIGWLTPVFIIILTVIISAIMGGGLITNWDEFNKKMIELFGQEASKSMEQIGKSINYNIWIFYLITILSGMIAGATINALAAFGEELGWRGFLFVELKPLGFITSSLIIGTIWGIWHAPIIAMGHNFPQHPLEGIFLMTLFCIALAFIMNYFREKSGSVILSSIMHGTINGTAGLYLYANTIRNDILYNLTGVSGIISVSIIAAIILLLNNKPTSQTSNQNH